MSNVWHTCRVGIAGNYGNHNTGDEAILAGILCQLSLVLPDLEVEVFSLDPADTTLRHGVKAVPLTFPTWGRSDARSLTTSSHRRFSRLRARLRGIPLQRDLRRFARDVGTVVHNREHLHFLYHRIRRLDAMTIGGGQLLMDWYPSALFLFGCLAWLTHLAGVPLMYYAVGAGPINTWRGRLYTKLALKWASVITVRDAASQEAIVALGLPRDRVCVTGDPAISLCTQRDARPVPREYGLKRVGVVPVPYYAPYYWPVRDATLYSAYVARMAKSCDTLIEQLDVCLTFWGSKYPHDLRAARDIVSQMQHREEVYLLERELDPQDFLDLVGTFDCIEIGRAHV